MLDSGEFLDAGCLADLTFIDIADGVHADPVGHLQEASSLAFTALP